MIFPIDDIRVSYWIFCLRLLRIGCIVQACVCQFPKSLYFNFNYPYVQKQAIQIIMFFKCLKYFFFKIILFWYHFIRMFYIETDRLTEVLRRFKFCLRLFEGLRWWELWQCLWHWLGVFRQSTMPQK